MDAWVFILLEGSMLSELKKKILLLRRNPRIIASDLSESHMRDNHFQNYY